MAQSPDVSTGMARPFPAPVTLAWLLDGPWESADSPSNSQLSGLRYLPFPAPARVY